MHVVTGLTFKGHYRLLGAWYGSNRIRGVLCGNLWNFVKVREMYCLKSTMGTELMGKTI